MAEIKKLKLGELQVNPENPRHQPQTFQRETIAAIAAEQGAKLANLAMDIAEKGLSPIELPLVSPAEDDPNTYIVMDGNRRISALKLMSSPSLAASIGLPKKLLQRFKELHLQYGDVLPTEITCAVEPAEDARHWMFVRHTGEYHGVGLVPWDGVQRARFRGISPSLQIIDLVAGSGLLDPDTAAKLDRIPITNIERLLTSPKARQSLGIDIRKGQLIFTEPVESVLGRLARVVFDVASRKITVSDIEDKDKRAEYAAKVAINPIVQGSLKPDSDGKEGETEQGSSSESEVADDSSSGKGANDGDTDVKQGDGKKQLKIKKQNPNRKSLIPPSCKIHISQSRINQMYDELQKLEVEKVTNSCAVLFRVFIEQSVEHFGKVKKIKFEIPGKPAKPCPAGAACKAGTCSAAGKCPAAKVLHGKPKPETMTLRQKITRVADYLEENGLSTKHELQGIRSLCANRHHVLSVDSLNGYVHNMDYNPTPTDLKANWDSIQVFVQQLWAV